MVAMEMGDDVHGIAVDPGGGEIGVELTDRALGLLVEIRPEPRTSHPRRAVHAIARAHL